jgi:hypothetical protein
MHPQFRYLQVAVERFSNKAQVTLVWNSPDLRNAKNAQLLVKQLKLNHGDVIHSIWINFRTGSGNVIFSRCECVRDDDDMM